MKQDDILDKEGIYLFKIYVFSAVVGTTIGLTMVYGLVAFLEILFNN